MESSPVSAFAVYKANKPKLTQNQSKKKRKPRNRKKPKNIQSNYGTSQLSEEVIRQGVQKMKQTQKFKESKTIAKKKTHKKKKAKEVKEIVKEAQINGKNAENKSRKTRKNSEDVPCLIPADLYNNLNNMEQSDSASSCSHSEDGTFDFTPVQTDSRDEALKVFKWMIAPYDPSEFFKRVWEKKPLHIARKKTNYYKEIISTPIIDDMLRNENIQYTKNIDITSYVNQKRETHNPEGRAYPHLVWDSYLNGCSIRLLNPQTYIPKLHLMNATMQEYFNSFVGANAYLTPPDSQGFAPHYDDIEAFILQAEGKKHWRIYKPRTEDETLPRFSSKNFDQDEIGEPIMEVTLEAGDMLYFPRGYIHQGVTIDGEHSLHVTISMFQKHSWADLFEKLIPAALQTAITKDVDFRRGLPFDIYDNFGIVSDENSPNRQRVEDIVFSLFEKMKEYLPIDAAVDQMHKNYQHDSLPPVLSDMEKAVTVHGDSDVMIEDGKVINRVEIDLDTNIRLLRKNIVRLVFEEDVYRLYYYAENSLEYHGNEITFIELEDNLVPGIENLIQAYPEYISVESLQLPEDTDKLHIADALWSRGLIMAEFPLNTVED